MNNATNIVKEHRFHSRKREEDSVKVNIIFAPGARYLENEELYCVSEDLSSQGLRLWMFSQPPEGSKVQLSIIFMNPPKRFIREGKIVWVKKHANDDTCSIGIEFTDTDKEMIDSWNYILEKKLL